MTTTALIIHRSRPSPQSMLDLDANTDLPITVRSALTALLIGTVVLLAVASLSGQRSSSGALELSRPATIMLPVMQTAWTPSGRLQVRDEPRGPITSPSRIATLHTAVSATSVDPTQPTGLTNDQHH